MGRVLGGYIVGVTSNWEHIPEHHKCENCFSNKHQVNFSVYEKKNKDGWNVAKNCNPCKSLINTERRLRNHINLDLVKVAVRKKRRVTFLLKFLEFTKENKIFIK